MSEPKIPEFSEEQRQQSFKDTRLNGLFEGKDKVEFNKQELAKFCLEEIDYAVDIVKNTDIYDVAEQFDEE